MNSPGSSASGRGRAKLLAIDDDPAYLVTIEALLADVGYDVVVANSGDEALGMIAAMKPDAVLVDWWMPGLSGPQTCERIKADPALRDIPVLLLTARDDADAVVEGMNAGADDYIEKRTVFEVLHARLSAQLRRKREARKRAEEASLDRTAFLASMSHRILTPLNAIVGTTSLLAETTIDEEQTGYVKTLRAGIDHLVQVVDDVLDFAKVEAGKLVIESYPFDVLLCTRESVQLVSAQAAAKGLALACMPSPSVPKLVVGDGARTRQVLANLLSNAVKFTERGEVLVRVDVNKGADREELVIEISDTGIGIPKEARRLLFQPFSLGELGTAPRVGGTGLGLAIVKRLVELMGGHIDVWSKEGEGSTFTVRLPLVLPPSQTRRSSSSGLSVIPGARRKSGVHFDPTFAQRHPLTILVADDHALNREVTARMLSRLGYLADTADDGRKALEAARAQPYDLVFMDLNMPVMDGIEATRAIVETLRDTRPTIIAMTASILEEERQSALAAGMDHYVTKPVTIQKLVEALTFASARRPRPGMPPDEQRKITETIARLRVELGDETPGFLREFVKDAAHLLMTIENALRTTDKKAVRAAAHQLKSNAALLDATRLSECAEDLERAAFRNDGAEVLALLRRCQAAFEATWRVLDASSVDPTP